MKNIIARLIGYAMVASTAHAVHSHSINKTFIAVRDQRNRSANFALYHYLRAQKSDDRSNGNLQATGFVTSSTNRHRLGQAFGANDKNPFTIGPAFTDDVDSQFILRFPTGTSTAKATMQLRPHQVTYGALFDYFQHLDAITEGLYFDINTPLVRVGNAMDVTFCEDKADTNNTGISSFAGFFAGGTNNINVDNLQNPLTRAKIASGEQTLTGFGDVECSLGYYVIDRSRVKLGLNASFIFPTGNDNKGCYVFEPVVGSSHYAIGVGLQGYVVMFKNELHEVRLATDAQYRYLLQEVQERTVGLKKPIDTTCGSDCLISLPFHHYYLVGELNQTGAPLFPAANVLTQPLLVKPHNQIDGTIAVMYRYHTGFSFEAGYNAFYKEAESVALKNPWPDNKYAIPTKTYKTSEALVLTDDVQTNKVESVINSVDLDLWSVTSATQFTNKFYGAIGYITQDADYPILVGVGGSYECATKKHRALSQYSFFAKLGIQF